MAERTVRWALERSLAASAGRLSDLDAATVALARRYADDLDEAAVVSVVAGRWLREHEHLLPGESRERLRALLARVEETTVLASLGPKLLAALAELAMSPRARADVVRRGGGGGDPPTDNPLARFRAERRRRLAGGAGVDAS